ncbi:hypothetical protein Ancab_035467 [Ancistrocladus abbreviatus]
MAGSETGVMTSTSPSMQKPPAAIQPMIQNTRLAYNADGTAVYKPVTDTSPTYQPPISGNGGSIGVGVGGGVGGDGSGGGGGGAASHGMNMNINMMGEPLKRKRGRPRKYALDGSMALALSPAQPAAITVTQSPGPFSPPSQPSVVSPPTSGAPGSPSMTMRKARGRPPGSSKKQQMEALGSVGIGFTPHVITVKAGEDVSSKIMSFSQHGPRAVCILSANGAISNVTLRQAATSGGSVTYEGRFEILSLSGSFLLSESGGQRSRTGGLSVSLAGPDGRVLGGGVAGLLTAAAPVQVVVGSFITDGRKELKPANQMEALSAPSKLGPSCGQIGASSPSRGTLSESSGGPGSPLNQEYRSLQ